MPCVSARRRAADAGSGAAVTSASTAWPCGRTSGAADGCPVTTGRRENPTKTQMSSTAAPSPMRTWRWNARIRWRSASSASRLSARGLARSESALDMMPLNSSWKRPRLSRSALAWAEKLATEDAIASASPAFASSSFPRRSSRRVFTDSLGDTRYASISIVMSATSRARLLLPACSARRIRSALASGK